MSARHKELSPAEAAKIREEWLRVVDELTQQVSEWAQDKKGWSVKREAREVREEPLGAYTVPVLEIEAPEGQVILEPIAHNAYRAQGRVDLYAYPSRYRVRLLRLAPGAPWIIRTDSGLDWPQPWSEDTFFTVAKGLMGAQ